MPRLFARLILTGALLAIPAGMLRADEPCRPPSLCDVPAAGLAVYLDPQGRPTFPGPTTPRVTWSTPFSGFKAASAPAIIEPAPGGGKMVRLGNRLATMNTADGGGGEPEPR